MRQDARVRVRNGRATRTYAALINSCISERPADMAACVHLCRGNARSLWFAEEDCEGYIADNLFNSTDVDGFSLNMMMKDRADSEPLRYVPKGSMKIVLGLVTTKPGKIESKDEIKRRIEEASRFVDINQLCLSPQCGFSSNAIGNIISEQEQFDKIGLIVDLATEMWGGLDA